MRILVCGGRNWKNIDTISDELDVLETKHGIDVVIEGDARGVDGIAGDWAFVHRITNLKFPADWKTHGKAAGVIRNQQMLDEGKPDLVVAFPGGRGTADMVRRAEKAGVEVYRPLDAPA